MLMTRSHRFFTGTKSRSVIFWFCLSLCFTGIYIALALGGAFPGDVVGDNAREYVSWMYRYQNPELFPHDLIADYFQSITPIGYGGLFRLLASLGVDPVLASKLLPIAVAFLTTCYGFAVCLQLLPVPMAGFITTLLLNQSLAMHDDFVSGTPRDFIYPLFLAFLYYLLTAAFLPCLVAIALVGLFYPPMAFIIAGVLLWRWRVDLRLCVAGVVVAGAVILPFALQSTAFGPTLTNAVAKTMPEYLSGGRVSYFHLSLLSFWLDGRDSGVLALMSPPQLFIGWVLPILYRFPQHFPLTQRVNKKVQILIFVVLASLVMFFIAHAVAFKLHWPSRYTHHTFRIVFALCAGVSITIMLDAVFSSARRLALLTTCGVLAGLMLFPLCLKSFPTTPFVTSSTPELYKFLQTQPHFSLIASLAGETDNIPVFAQRSILVGKEYALPIHTKYYQQFRQRMLDLITAQYSLDINFVKAFINKYAINLWVIERSAFQKDYLTDNRFLKQYQPANTEAIAHLQQGTPAIGKIMQTCTVFEAKNLVVLNAECLAK